MKIFVPINLTFITTLIFPLIFNGCAYDKEKTQSLTISVEERIIPSDGLSHILNVTTSDEWNIELSYRDNINDWCDITNKTHESALLTYSKNSTETLRELTLTVESKGDKVSLEIKQLGTEDIDPNRPTGWLELPYIDPKGSELYVNHYIDLEGNRYRNYSMLFDTNKRIAYWVAYPLHSMYIGEQGRTHWELDPKIPKDAQLSYSIYNNYGYDRGHQIPSADRTCNAQANAQTFYFSNITPQTGRNFNQKIWANLERMVRGYISDNNSSDTLYVVTGAVLQTVGGSEKIDYVVNDDVKQPTAIPNYYFKVLLRLKESKYDAIGFWFDHKTYPYSKPMASDMKSVDDIERLTGYDFFVNLPKSIQDRVEKECKPNNWDVE